MLRLAKPPACPRSDQGADPLCWRDDIECKEAERPRGSVLKRESAGWETALGVAIILTLFAALGLVAGFGWKGFTEFLSGPAAGWVQAVGSIVAVIGAGHLGRQQIVAAREDAERARLEADDERLRQVLCVAIYAADICDEVAQEISSPERLQNYIDFVLESLDFDGAEHALNIVDFVALRSISALEGVLAVRKALRSLHRLSEHAEQEYTGVVSDFEAFHDTILMHEARARKGVDQIARAVDLSRDRLEEFEQRRVATL